MFDLACKERNGAGQGKVKSRIQESKVGSRESDLLHDILSVCHNAISGHTAARTMQRPFDGTARLELFQRGPTGPARNKEREGLYICTMFPHVTFSVSKLCPHENVPLPELGSFAGITHR
jgi:hypothetical protein